MIHVCGDLDFGKDTAYIISINEVSHDIKFCPTKGTFEYFHA